MTVKTRKPTRWEIETLRAGKAHRDANPSTTPEGKAQDAALDEWLEAAEALYAQGAGIETGADVGELPEGPRGRSNGNSTYRADGPTEAQLRFIAKLCDELGRDADDRPTPATKRDASLTIDALKKQADHARRAGTAAPKPQRMATENQVAFLNDLAVQRATGMTPETLDTWDPTALTFDDASTLISAWLTLPRVKGAKAAHGIPAGRYAYQPEGDAPAQFYRVSRTGQLLVQAGPAEHPYRGQLNEALQAIKADPRIGAALYGQLIGQCGRCGLALTDEESRARGLGPVCADKGW